MSVTETLELNMLENYIFWQY